MKNLEIKNSNSTPYLKLTDIELTIIGRSFPENALDFYKPIINIINEIDKFEQFTINLCFEYLNTSSNKAIVYIIKNIADKTKNEVKLIWSIDEDDESMVELYENYKSIINNVNFEIKIIK